MSQAEIPRKVGVTEQAVSWRVKRLRETSQDQDLPTIIDDSNFQGNPSLKNQLKAKELKFLENYIIGGLTIEKAMLEAGYIGYHQKSLYRTGRKIVEKYEQQAPDHRRIFRFVGIGELQVAKGILELCQ
jgi:hypothetical protein